MRSLCERDRCLKAGSNALGNLSKLAAQLKRRPIDTFAISPTGKITEAEINEEALMNIVFSADFNLFIYNQLPGMLTRSLRGNDDQLVRLFAITEGAVAAVSTRREARAIARRIKPAKRTGGTTKAKGDRVEGRDAAALAYFSSTMFFATTCADFNPPWARSEDVSNRQPAINAAADALAPEALYPFSRTTVRNLSTASYCRGWQQRAALPAIAPGPLPNVPTLALEGTLDLRTPIAWAEKAIAGNPRAELVKIPSTGHSVVGTDLSGCALSLAKRFLIYGATDGKCKKTTGPLPIAPLPPTSVRNTTSPPGHCTGLSASKCQRARREVAAGYLGLRDTLDQVLIGGMDAGTGLVDGEWEMEYDISDDLTTIFPVGFFMESVSTVPDASVTGFVDTTALPGVFATLRFDGFKMSVSGSVSADRALDKLTISGRRGKAHVTVFIKPSKKAKSSGSRPINNKALAVRRNYLLGTAAPLWQRQP
jgi:hypothetical protein